MAGPKPPPPAPRRGLIRADEAYTVAELAAILGFDQPRHVAAKLEARGVRLDEWGRGWHKTFVSGRILLESIDRANHGDPPRCLGDATET